MGLEELVRGPVRGLKPYVPGKPIEEVQRELGLEHVVKLASNENPLGASPRALEAVVVALSCAGRYPENSAYALRQALAGRLDVSPDSLTFGNGSSEVITMVCDAFLSQGEEAVIAEDTFVVYRLAATIAGASQRLVPLKDMTYDLDAMCAAVGPKTKVVFLCSPNNPTGTANASRELARFMERVPERVLVVLDQAYVEYCDPEYDFDPLPYVRDGRRLVVLRTFSKVYGLAGLRVGYGISTPQIADYLNRVRPPFNVSCLAQVAAVAALNDGRHVKRSREANRAGRDFLYKEFDRLRVSYTPTQANFITFDCGDGGPEICQHLLEAGVVVRPLVSFGMAPRYLRVTIGTQEENEVFISALGRILGGG